MFSAEVAYSPLVFSARSLTRALFYYITSPPCRWFPFVAFPHQFRTESSGSTE